MRRDGAHHLLISAVVPSTKHKVRFSVEFENAAHGVGLGRGLVPHLDHSIAFQHAIRATFEYIFQLDLQFMGLKLPILRISTAVVPG